jgi:hypothetical protein
VCVCVWGGGGRRGGIVCDETGWDVTQVGWDETGMGEVGCGPGPPRPNQTSLRLLRSQLAWPMQRRGGAGAGRGRGERRYLAVVVARAMG